MVSRSHASSRRTSPTRHIVIVALTAFAMKGDDDKARKAGCDGYITKPIDTRKLAGLVLDHLRRAGGGR